MRSSYSSLMQSKFFNPAFNSAIFDGPVRIYFAQFHEALALKIYFLIQQKLKLEMAKAKQAAKASGANILVMIYPTIESFELSFANSTSPNNPLEVEKWNEDVVIGLCGPLDEDRLDLLIETLRMTMEDWDPAPRTASSASAEV